MPQSRPTSIPHTETSVGFPKAKAAVQEQDLERLNHSVTVQLLGIYQGTPVFTRGAGKDSSEWWCVLMCKNQSPIKVMSQERRK